jgi:hypothetical protein
MDKVMAAMNAGDMPKISKFMAYRQKKAADAAKEAEAAKKPAKAAAKKTATKMPVKKAAASKKVARKTMKPGKKKR